MSMSPCLVEQISDYLPRKRSITVYDSEMILCQFTDLQEATKMMQTVINKGKKAWQQFCKLLESCDPLLCERVAGPPASDPVLENPLPSHNATQIGQQNVPPTLLVINIHDSILNNCIFGSNNGQHITTERQCVSPHSSESTRRGAGRCSCQCSQQGPAESSPAPQNLQVHSSDLGYVVIGDNNTLIVDEVDEEEEEGEEEEQALYRCEQ
ncbi:hypothetical protein AGOR_G00113050 [Albula goreensis]|uniref:CARD domain-containing protein n=1 Tax=Albula goreensis TaxID=1534307 RepID=A0A8T3D9D4_9TELE|nr:hypothetical protein AGOR_G00113050 [Albula goreensis]